MTPRAISLDATGTAHPPCPDVATYVAHQRFHRQRRDNSWWCAACLAGETLPDVTRTTPGQRQRRPASPVAPRGKSTSSQPDRGRRRRDEPMTELEPTTARNEVAIGRVGERRPPLPMRSSSDAHDVSRAMEGGGDFQPPPWSPGEPRTPRRCRFCGRSIDHLAPSAMKCGRDCPVRKRDARRRHDRRLAAARPARHCVVDGRLIPPRPGPGRFAATCSRRCWLAHRAALDRARRRRRRIELATASTTAATARSTAARPPSPPDSAPTRPGHRGAPIQP
jgi:predicted nucleic acid-binding Zn ribbon protein